MREELLSVGIDIGTSTTQLVFSKLIIENVASSFTVPRISIVDKEVIYRSDVHFTPLKSMTEIDAEKVKEIVTLEYEKSGIKKEDIQTGAVIITGETARKENANEVLHTLSGFAGDFVVATAGPDLESIIAAKGAGAHLYSEEHSTVVVNLDIGGGTTNLAVFNRGDLKETGCLDIGGRLIKLEVGTNKIIYIAPKIQKLIADKNLDIREGYIASREMLNPIIKEMVRLLEESVGITPATPNLDRIITNKNIELKEEIKCISFSGGVADYVYNDKPIDDYFKFGDVGILLGDAIKHSDLCTKLKLIRSVETIRATVVGAGSHTMDISGSTITYTHENFPLKNLPILKLSEEDEVNGPEVLKKAVVDKLGWFKYENELQNVALALQGRKNPTFVQVQETAKGIVEGAKEILDRKLPLIVIVETDMAKVLGQAIYSILVNEKDIVCIDGIKVENGDYIDIGKPVAEGKVLPVVIKTLVFN
ncbi:ethanolamine ammonia-lyase reactivating factor EutA [Clostridium culturomicium]|uniref:ethanolamine ammonia-lyase reactivating factor EutA n=1 Tax=Clostridium culturomicium TaxID=1499683 RepID=UPI000590E5B2|nr:ethanolamine ammonia-lyase reactivating factor EutA [Clostridium culturomicium]